MYTILEMITYVHVFEEKTIFIYEDKNDIYVWCCKRSRAYTHWLYNSMYVEIKSMLLLILYEYHFCKYLTNHNYSYSILENYTSLQRFQIGWFWENGVWDIFKSKLGIWLVKAPFYTVPGMCT